MPCGFSFLLQLPQAAAVMELLEVKDRTQADQDLGSKDATKHLQLSQDNSTVDHCHCAIEVFTYENVNPESLSERDRSLFDAGLMTGMVMQLGFDEIAIEQSLAKVSEAEYQRDIAIISHNRLVDAWSAKAGRR